MAFPGRSCSRLCQEARFPVRVPLCKRTLCTLPAWKGPSPAPASAALPVFPGQEFQPPPHLGVAAHTGPAGNTCRPHRSPAGPTGQDPPRSAPPYRTPQSQPHAPAPPSTRTPPNNCILRRSTLQSPTLQQLSFRTTTCSPHPPPPAGPRPPETPPRGPCPPSLPTGPRPPRRPLLQDPAPQRPLQDPASQQPLLEDPAPRSLPIGPTPHRRPLLQDPPCRALYYRVLFP